MLGEVVRVQDDRLALVGRCAVSEGAVTYADFGLYNARAQPSKLTFGNGATTDYTYLNDRLYTLKTKAGGVSLVDLTYAYDPVGNVKTLTDGVDATATRTFLYDGLNRLVHATSTAATLDYVYDELGNILSKEGVAYAYDPIRVHAVTATTSGRNYAYDGNGNVLSDGLRVITYDYDNRPGSVTVGGGTVSFTYDAAGVRVLVTSTGQTRYYHPDQLGSTRVVTDQPTPGQPVQVLGTTRYRPFGEAEVDTSSVVSHKFTGAELDDETGLYFLQARYYDPVLGRFMSPDSLVENHADPQTLNRYSYCSNNPVRYVDPSGHSKRGWKLAIAATIIAATITVDALSGGTATPLTAALTAAAIGEIVGAAGGGRRCQWCAGRDRRRRGGRRNR